QAEALQRIAVSGRVVDVLVGPAGAGKTTAMSALKRAWEKQHGAGSVVGLAPSENAAQVLGEELGIATENTARWWQMHLLHGTTFDKDQLVILDEASLAGTGSLDLSLGARVRVSQFPAVHRAQRERRPGLLVAPVERTHAQPLQDRQIGVGAPKQ